MKKLYPIEIITNSENTVYLPTDFKASTHLNKIALGALSKDATIQQHKKQGIRWESLLTFLKICFFHRQLLMFIYSQMKKPYISDHL